MIENTATQPSPGVGHFLSAPIAMVGHNAQCTMHNAPTMPGGWPGGEGGHGHGWNWLMHNRLLGPMNVFLNVKIIDGQYMQFRSKSVAYNYGQDC